MNKIKSFILTTAALVSTSSMVFANLDFDPDVGENNGFASAAGKVLGYVQWFGYALAIGMLIYIGIKYMMASANEKADLKKGSINYVIGAILVAGASAIVGVLSSIGGSITG